MRCTRNKSDYRRFAVPFCGRRPQSLIAFPANGDDKFYSHFFPLNNKDAVRIFCLCIFLRTIYRMLHFNASIFLIHLGIFHIYPFDFSP